MSTTACFIDVPRIVLPDGTVVPAFRVGKYLCGRDDASLAIVAATAPPWTLLSYFEAVEASRDAGRQLISELQCLAIAHDICRQGVNWSGGAFGIGKVFQGLHKGSVAAPQASTFISHDPEERRWHQLSNGAIILDFAGNACTWVFDDVQGGVFGLKRGSLVPDSPSLAAAPFASGRKGMGWRPHPGRDWSGDALYRGGGWDDGQHAGVFSLGVVAPDHRDPKIGFRCVEDAR